MRVYLEFPFWHLEPRQDTPHRLVRNRIVAVQAPASRRGRKSVGDMGRKSNHSGLRDLQEREKKSLLWLLEAPNTETRPTIALRSG